MPQQRHLIGIVGGLGPYAHVDFERKLLAAAHRLLGASTDQDYPEWVLSSVPPTPDRTLALRGESDDALPALLKSLRRLEAAGAEFAVVACNTAHAYFPQLRAEGVLPLLDMVALAAAHVAGRWPGLPIGILATTGTLTSGLYHDALRERNSEPVTLLDLDGGQDLQERHVMTPIYGELDGANRRPDGIKAAGPNADHAAALEAGAFLLADHFDAAAIIAACTEIPLALTGKTAGGVPLIDPAMILAEATIRRAYGLDG